MLGLFNHCLLVQLIFLVGFPTHLEQDLGTKLTLVPLLGHGCLLVLLYFLILLKRKYLRVIPVLIDLSIDYILSDGLLRFKWLFAVCIRIGRKLSIFNMYNRLGRCGSGGGGGRR